MEGMNIEHPTAMHHNDGGIIIVTRPRHEDTLPRPFKGNAGRSNGQHRTSNEEKWEEQE